MTLQQLHYVLTIADAGSFNKAAETLYVSQPSLSNAVRDLEKELSITIFHRSGRGVTPTNDGAEFLLYARQVYHQYEQLREKYGGGETLKKKFGVSAQHFSFAVKAFAELVNSYDTAEYEFAIRETETRDVIDDVCTLKSEIGILFLSDFNRPVLSKLFRANGLSFHKLIDCKTYVYLWREHPLAKKKTIRFADFANYPNLSFEQSGTGSFYFAEEIFSQNEYPRSIKVSDRATVLNLMVGLHGFILCSGIICEELNGSDYVAVPFEEGKGGIMEIGYITRQDSRLSRVGERYIEELKKYLGNAKTE